MKNYLLFTLLLISVHVIGQQHPAGSAAGVGLTASAPANIPDFANEVRVLDELNKEDKADAYPWISNDGLRLYFTQAGREGDGIMVAERPDTYHPFNTPVSL